MGRSACSVQVLVGSVIQWRRTATSPVVIASNRSVPLWIVQSRGRSRDPLRSRGGPVLRGELNPGDGFGEGLLVGTFPCGWWGWRSGHLVVLLLQGLRFL